MGKKIYLASPLGFSGECSGYRNRLVETLRRLDFEVHDPWDNGRTHEFDEKLAETGMIGDHDERCTAYLEIAKEMGRENESAIRESDMLVAVLDGMEPDSGTVAELGFAAGLGKKCHGIRADARSAGDFPGVPINLQVLRFIERGGGKLFRALQELEDFFRTGAGDA
ncbi:MAG: 2-deoxyribonucleoside glycosidase [Deltaproteobacteria bacterium]|nr:2-deoxyribonucleoside glycosidase [Deltaproteobacteria bacterium]